jgi:hypothetical protein
MKATDYIPFALLLAAIGGYIANIVALINSTETMGMMIARAVGIVVAPLGSILGFF